MVRQERGEDGAARGGVGFASDPDAAAVAGDDVVGDPEAETVADILFGGEEGVKDFGERFPRDAGTVVDEADGGARALAVAPRLRSSDSDREAAVLRHGVDCVGNLIGEGLAQFAFQSPDLEFVAILFVDGEVLRFQLAVEQDEEIVEKSR